MAEISDSLRLLFETAVERDGDRYVVRIPKQFVDGGSLSLDEQYRIALIASETGSEADVADTADTAPKPAGQLQSESRSASTTPHTRAPPVEEGEVRSVTIDTLGDQGDGIAKVERGFVVIVSDAEPGDEVDVRITNVKDTVAFAEPVA